MAWSTAVSFYTFFRPHFLALSFKCLRTLSLSPFVLFPHSSFYASLRPPVCVLLPPRHTDWLQESGTHPHPGLTLQKHPLVHIYTQSTTLNTFQRVCFSHIQHNDQRCTSPSRKDSSTDVNTQIAAVVSLRGFTWWLAELLQTIFFCLNSLAARSWTTHWTSGIEF